MGRLSDDERRRAHALTDSVRPALIRLARHRRYYALLALVCLGVYCLLPTSRPKPPPLWSLDDGVGVGAVPLVNFIVIHKAGSWYGFGWPVTMEYLVASVRRQPQAIAMTIIERAEPENCSVDIQYAIRDTRNIQYVCMPESDFWAEHVRYLCDHWGGCGQQQRQEMHGDLMLMGDMIEAHATFPIVHGYVFRDYVHPRAAFWGWTDTDLAFGDFAQTFPYDLALDYDVVAASAPGGSGPELIMAHGHFTLVRNRASTAEAMMRFPAVATYAGFENVTLHEPMDEGPISSFLVRDPGIDFLQFDGLHTMRYLGFGAAGVLELPPALVVGERPAIPAPAFAQLDRALPDPYPASFTDCGVETAVEVHAGDAVPFPSPWLWFPPQFANWHHTAPGPPAADWTRYVFKRNGQWTQRFEPPRYIEHGPLKGARSWLYVHWQEVKKRHNELTDESYFKGIAEHPMPRVAIMDDATGVLGLDATTEPAFWLPRITEDCDPLGCVPPGQLTPTKTEKYTAWRAADAAKRERFYAAKRKRHGW
ncbi:hypothetical protein Q5752_002327 [Cryptotrichosporon argae]